MRGKVLVLVVSAAACASFGAENGGGTATDGGATDGSSSGAPGDASPGSTTGFCARHKDAKFCEDWDAPNALDQWTDKSTTNRGRVSLVPSPSPPSAPYAAEFFSPSPIAASACDDRAIVAKTLPASVTVGALTWEVKARLETGDVQANGGPSIELYASDSSTESCTFYLAWRNAVPYLYVDHHNADGGERDAQPTFQLASAVPLKTWTPITMTLVPGAAGTKVTATVGGAATPELQIPDCNGAVLKYLELDTGCLSAVQKTFTLDLDDFAVRW